MAKEIYYRWYTSSISEARQVLKNAKEKFNTNRYSKMPKKSLIPNKPREEWTKDEELAYLRMENAYLKKYMALVQEDEKKKQQQKKDREKSKLSEN